MNYKHLTYLLLTSPLLLHAENETPSCTTTHDLNRVSIRHIESNGIGYNQGYTTLEGFFVPLPSLNTRWVPFLDLRGHIFNNAKPAANAGLGLRYIDSRVWGANIYYDYRKTSHKNYNQVSFGLESLGRYLDYRVNGYFPVGKHKSSLYDPQYDSFSGHSVYISRKQQLALKGGNAEVGVHIAKVKGIDFYSALGPYYFGNDTKHTFGGEFRIGMDVLKILRIEGNTSYDHLFKWIGQGQISLSYGFTPKTMTRKQKKGSCSFHGYVRDRAFQRVDKQEIIVVTTQKKKSVAINPATGLPYVVWFVDNTSHSQGTYESPFNTLADAQASSHANDIIAVLPGDGTDTGMNSGITLQSGQKLWDMSVTQTLPTTLGTIKIKPLASVMPTLSNRGGGTHVVTGANSNDIIGLKIVETQGNKGIFISNKSGTYTIANNIISTQQTGQGLFMEVNSLGTSQIVNNTFLGADNTNNLGVLIYNSQGHFIISNNLFTGTDASSGLSLGIQVTIGTGTPTVGQYSIVSNMIHLKPTLATTVKGISLYPNGSSQAASVLIADNQIHNVLGKLYNGTVSSHSAGISCPIYPETSLTLRNNKVTTLDPAIPAYFLSDTGGGVPAHANVAPDNVGRVQYGE